MKKLSFKYLTFFRLGIKRDNLLILSIVVSFTTELRAQKDYALTINGDTLRGELTLFANNQNDRDLNVFSYDRLVIKSEGNKKTYTSLQIREFLKGGESYLTVKRENSYCFMRVIKKGYLSLCAFQLQDNSLWDGRYLYKKNGSGIEVPHFSFKKMVVQFLSDCPCIAARIERDKLGIGDLEKIMDVYNHYIESRIYVSTFGSKIGSANFSSRNDAQEMIHDVQSKVSRCEAIPDYLIQGLQSSLAEMPDLAKEWESIAAILLKN